MSLVRHVLRSVEFKLNIAEIKNLHVSIKKKQTVSRLRLTH